MFAAYLPVRLSLTLITATSRRNLEGGLLCVVGGLPSNISSIGKTTYAKNGNVYISINITDGYPAIYKIDTSTAQAVKGLTIDKATDINGFGYMEPIK